MGRVWLREPKNIPPRNHMAILAYLEGHTFITDVGFGGLTTRVPLDIYSNEEVDDGDGLVRIIKCQKYGYMLQRKLGEDWKNQYSFETAVIGEEDIRIANFFMSRSPDSHFFNHCFIGLFTSKGRVGLFDNMLSERVGTTTVETKEIGCERDWLHCLKHTFNLRLDLNDEERHRLFNHQIFG